MGYSCDTTSLKCDSHFFPQFNEPKVISNVSDFCSVVIWGLSVSVFVLQTDGAPLERAPGTLPEGGLGVHSRPLCRLTPQERRLSFGLFLFVGEAVVILV